MLETQHTISSKQRDNRKDSCLVLQNQILHLIDNSKMHALLHIQIERIIYHKDKHNFSANYTRENLFSKIIEELCNLSCQGKLEGIIPSIAEKKWKMSPMEQMKIIVRNDTGIQESIISSGNYYSWTFSSNSSIEETNQQSSQLFLDTSKFRQEENQSRKNYSKRKLPDELSKIKKLVSSYPNIKKNLIWVLPEYRKELQL